MVVEYETNGESTRIVDVQNSLTGLWVCLDATRAFDTLGKIIKHSSTPSLKPMQALLEGELKLAFLATRDIAAGEELFYNCNMQVAAKKTSIHS